METKIKAKKKCFLDIIEDIKNQIHNNPTSSIFEVILTMNGRIPLEIGEKSLNVNQKEIVKYLKKVDFTFSNEFIEDRPYFYTLGMKKYGRIILEDNYQKDNYDIVFGYIYLEKISFDLINTNCSIANSKERRYLEDEVYPFFHNKSDEDITGIVKYVYNILYFMAPVLIYINDETFTNFYNFNNLFKSLDGDTSYYIMDELLEKPFSVWTENEVTFIYNMYWLLKSGGPPRGEEANGLHLSFTFIHEYLDKKIKKYSNLLDSKNEKTNSVNNIPEKSKLVDELRKKVKEKYLFFREINGLNLYKDEKILGRLSDLNTKFVPESIFTYVENKYKLNLRTSNVYDFFRDFIEEFFKGNLSNNDEFMDPIEDLFTFIVDLAIETTNSDIGMTRGFRSPTALIKAHNDNDIETMCNWKQNEYYCCVVPNKKTMIKPFESNMAMLAGILSAISKRMQYNSWHYTPGNLPFNELPKDRHFYFPPVMPDITEWSDQHHRGHIFASVRNAIRSPGAVTVSGKTYLAYFDLRLMKQKGDKYTEEDLKVAVYYTGLLQYFHQALIDTVIKLKKDYSIHSFSKEWYQKYYSNR